MEAKAGTETEAKVGMEMVAKVGTEREAKAGTETGAKVGAETEAKAGTETGAKMMGRVRQLGWCHDRTIAGGLHTFRVLAESVLAPQDVHPLP